MAKNTAARIAANNRWTTAHYITASAKIPRETMDELKALASEKGTTVNAIIKTAIQDYLEFNR